MEKEKHLQTSKHPFFFLIPAVCFFRVLKKVGDDFCQGYLKIADQDGQSFICEPQWLMLHVLKSGTLQGKTARRQSRCTAGARLQNLSWQRLFGAGRSVLAAGHQHLFFGRIRVSKITPRLHLPSSGFFDIIS